MRLSTRSMVLSDKLYKWPYPNSGTPLQKRDYDAAVTAWYEALRLDPRQPATLGNLSAVCLLQKRYHECRWLCKRALARIANSQEEHALEGDSKEEEEGSRYTYMNVSIPLQNCHRLYRTVMTAGHNQGG